MVPDSASGVAASSFCAGGGVVGGVGGAAAFLVSKEPTCNWPWYFLKMPALWYFQNCFDASFPATRWRTDKSQCLRPGKWLGEAVLFFPPAEVSVGRNIRYGPRSTWMLVLKLAQIIDIFVDDDPKTVRLIMRRNVALGEGFGHGAGDAETSTDARRV